MLRLLVLAVTHFVNAAGAALLAAMTQAGQPMVPTRGIWIVAVITGGIAAAASVQASLGVPPKKGGGG